MTLLAYHNKKSLKAETVKAMKADIAAERLIAGHYWNGRSGCFVGCVIRGNEHSKFEEVLGIPQKIARLADGIFEGIGEHRSKFSVDILKAIQPGADLSGVADKFLHWLLMDKTDGVIKYAKTPAQKKAIQDIGKLYARKIKGEDISYDTWMKARSAAAAYAAAYAAAAAAAYADADAAAAAAAAAYADAAAAAAADADAYADAAAAAARQGARLKQAAKLLQLLKEAPVIKSTKKAA